MTSIFRSSVRSLFQAGSASFTETQGLFGNPRLRKPDDFIALCQETKQKCNALLQQIAVCPPDASVVQLMDDMSDEICRTYDAAECCRNVHSEPTWRQAAATVCHDLGDFLSVVNQDETMYGKLTVSLEALRQTREAAATAKVFSLQGSASLADADDGVSASAAPPAPPLSRRQLARWTAETELVAVKLRQDMKQAGIDLPPAPRHRMQQLMNLGNHYAALFSRALTDPKALGSIQIQRNASAARGAFGLFKSGSSLVLDPASVGSLMASEPDEDIRRMVLLHAGSSPACNRRVLDEMLLARREMASLAGCDSFAQMKAAGNSLAGRPGAVTAFLGELATGVRPAADREVQRLMELKARELRQPGGAAALEPWDTDYYMARAETAAAPAGRTWTAE